MSQILNAEPGDFTFDPMMSEISPGVQPISTKLWNAVIANALDRKLQVWSDEAITTPRTLLQDIDLTGITVPTYLLYGIDD